MIKLATFLTAFIPDKVIMSIIHMRCTICSALLPPHYIAIKESYISEVIDYVVHCCRPEFFPAPLLSLLYHLSSKLQKPFYNSRMIAHFPGAASCVCHNQVFCSWSSSSLCCIRSIWWIHSHPGSSCLLSHQVVPGLLICFWFLSLAGLRHKFKISCNLCDKRLLFAFFFFFNFKKYDIFK